MGGVSARVIFVLLDLAAGECSLESHPSASTPLVQLVGCQKQRLILKLLNLLAQAILWGFV